MADSPEYKEHSPIVRMDISNRVVLTPESSITFENCQEIEKAVNDAVKENAKHLLAAKPPTAARNAMRKAHDARGEALSSVWAWLFRTSR